MKWLRKAAEQGSARAQCLLGLNYANGDGVKPDKVEAARWLRRAADQGLAEAQFESGHVLRQRGWVPRNAAEAADWYRKAAEQALPEAESELGNCYLEGNGVPKDIPEGIKWTRRAANAGIRAGPKHPRPVLHQGQGVPKDYVQAYKWFNLAAAKGGQRADDARINLASAERYLTPEQVAEAQRLAREFKPHKTQRRRKLRLPPAKAAARPKVRDRTPTDRASHAAMSAETVEDRRRECEGGGRHLRDLR